MRRITGERPTVSLRIEVQKSIWQRKRALKVTWRDLIRVGLHIIEIRKPKTKESTDGHHQR